MTFLALSATFSIGLFCVCSWITQQSAFLHRIQILLGQLLYICYGLVFAVVTLWLVAFKNDDFPLEQQDRNIFAGASLIVLYMLIMLLHCVPACPQEASVATAPAPAPAPVEAAPAAEDRRIAEKSESKHQRITELKQLVESKLKMARTWARTAGKMSDDLNSRRVTHTFPGSFKCPWETSGDFSLVQLSKLADLEMETQIRKTTEEDDITHLTQLAAEIDAFSTDECEAYIDKAGVEMEISDAYIKAYTARTMVTPGSLVPIRIVKRTSPSESTRDQKERQQREDQEARDQASKEDEAKRALDIIPQQPTPSENDRKSIDDRTLALMEPNGNACKENTPIGENSAIAEGQGPALSVVSSITAIADVPGPAPSVVSSPATSVAVTPMGAPSGNGLQIRGSAARSIIPMLQHLEAKELLRKQVEDLKAKVASQEAAFSMQHTTILAKTGEIQYLRDRLKNSRDDSGAKARLEKEVETLQQRLNGQTAQLRQSHEVQTLVARKAELDSEIAAQQRLVETTNVSLEESNQTLVQRDEQIASRRAEIRKLEKSHQKALELTAAAQTQAEEAHKQAEEARKLAADAQETLDAQSTVVTQKQELSDQNQRLQEQVRGLREQLQRAATEKQVQEAKEQFATQQKTILDQEKQIRALQEKQASDLHQHQEAVAAIAQEAQEKLNAQQIELDQKVELLLQCQAKVEEQEEKINELQAQGGAATSLEIQKAREECTAQQLRLDEKDVLLGQHQATIQSLESRIHELQAHNAAITATAEAAQVGKNTFSVQLQEKDRLVSLREQQIRAQEEQIQELREQRGAASLSVEEKRAADQKYADLEKKFNQTFYELSQSQSENRTLNNEVSDLKAKQAKNERSSESLASLRHQIQEQTRFANEAEAAYSRKERQAYDWENKCAAAEREKSRAAQEARVTIEALKEQLKSRDEKSLKVWSQFETYQSAVTANLDEQKAKLDEEKAKLDKERVQTEKCKKAWKQAEDRLAEKEQELRELKAKPSGDTPSIVVPAAQFMFGQSSVSNGSATASTDANMTSGSTPTTTSAPPLIFGQGSINNGVAAVPGGTSMTFGAAPATTPAAPFRFDQGSGSDANSASPGSIIASAASVRRAPVTSFTDNITDKTTAMDEDSDEDNDEDQEFEDVPINWFPKSSQTTGEASAPAAPANPAFQFGQGNGTATILRKYTEEELLKGTEEAAEEASAPTAPVYSVNNPGQVFPFGGSSSNNAAPAPAPVVFPKRRGGPR